MSPLRRLWHFLAAPDCKAAHVSPRHQEGIPVVIECTRKQGHDGKHRGVDHRTLKLKQWADGGPLEDVER